MALADLKEFSKIKLDPAPSFYNTLWEKHNGILTFEQIVALKDFMGPVRHTFNTPFHYMVKSAVFVYFQKGHTAEDAWALFHFKRTTMYDWYKEYSEYSKNL